MRPRSRVLCSLELAQDLVDLDADLVHLDDIDRSIAEADQSTSVGSADGCRFAPMGALTTAPGTPCEHGSLRRP
jgi:hypothetical protein